MRRSGLPPIFVALAGAAAGLIVAWACGIRLPGRTSSRPAAAPRLVSDADGTIRSVCIHYRTDFHAACIDTYSDLFRALETGTRVYVAVREESEFRQFAHELGHRGIDGVELIPVVTHLPITPWAKDRFGTFEREGRPVLGLPPEPHVKHGPRGNDHTVPLRLASREEGIEGFALPFRFDGGDLLADERTAFVPANFLYRNPLPNAAARKRLIERISNSLGREVVLIGETPGDVPDHHIGMVLTPLGEGRVAVADPDLGLRLLDAAKLTLDIGIDRDGAHYQPFRTVATAAARAGYQVIRVPMLLTTMPRVYVTYNNAIVETRGAQRRIYMPTYQMPALDAAARKVFEGAGLEVVPVDVSMVYRHTGSLRCLVGVVARGEMDG